MTEREKKLSIVLPMVAVVAIYGWFVMRTKYPELQQARTALKNALDKVPTETQLATERGKLAVLNREFAEAEKQKKELLLRWEATVGCCADPVRRHARLEKLTELLGRHGLRLVEDADSGSTRGTKVAAALQTLLHSPGQPGGQVTGPQPLLRKLRFKGRYGQVYKVLAELDHGDILAIPVGIAMKEASHGDVHEWTLLVWI